MPKITIDQIITNLPNNWKLISDTYENLDSELKFQCPEGHEIYSTWKKMREHCECPVCKANYYKDQDSKIIEKKPGLKRTLALDQASHITGYAIFDGKELIKYGFFEAKDGDEVGRYKEIKEWLISQISLWQPDVVGLEGIQYQANFGVTTFQTLARLQGILMETCYSLGKQFQICPTATWRSYCGVKGKSRADQKKSMQLLIKEWFDVSVRDDCADAIGIGKFVAETK